ncbi:MAG: hypothetical protein ACPGOV_06945 [Magnetovibrionaceae bacterium]
MPEPLDFGISEEGLKAALLIKESYKRAEPLTVPGERNRLLAPENLLTTDIDLSGLDDPIALAMVATRDPESPMALAAATRLSPKGNAAGPSAKSKVVRGVFQMIGEKTKHPAVSQCVDLVTENAFAPEAIHQLRRHASRFISQSRKEYTTQLRQNLVALMEGAIAPRAFINDFFSLTEAGNLRTDIRRKLVVSLLLGESIRPSIKFLMLENFHRMPLAVRHGIIEGVLRAEPGRHTDMIKEELKWIVRQDTLKKPKYH